MPIIMKIDNIKVEQLAYRVRCLTRYRSSNVLYIYVSPKIEGSEFEIAII